MRRVSGMEKTGKAAAAFVLAATLAVGTLAGCSGPAQQDGQVSSDQTGQEQQAATEGAQGADASSKDEGAAGQAGGEAQGSQQGQAPSAQENEESAQAEGEESDMAVSIEVSVNDTTWTARLEDSASSQAFVGLLERGPVTVRMRDYAGMEKVGDLPVDLPRSDRPTDVGPGDIVLYQGDQITIYYGTNSWNFTRLGSIQGVDGDALLAVLGAGDAEVAFSLAN